MHTNNFAMQLTRGADYGVRVMIHLATLQPRERALLPDLAAATETPMSFLSKVLQALAHAKLIESRRGKAGGFAILARGRAASICDVVEAIDGPIFLNTCLCPEKSCSRKAWCAAHPVWAEAQRAMLEVLKRGVIDDLAAQSAGAGALASGPAAPALVEELGVL